MRYCLMALSIVCLPFFTKGQRCNKTVRINPDEPTSTYEKPGYKLYFQDEFDGENLDTLRWNRSSWSNEWAECHRNVIYNPNNPHLKNGVAVLPVTADSSHGCPVSGSELKTFSILKGFSNYRFFPGSYFEIRAKLIKGANAGCAGWLYFNWLEGNLYREVDLWETRPSRPDRFQSNFHLKSGGGKAWWVCLRDLDGNPVDVSQTYVTFGFDWQPRRLRFYINNQLVRDVKLKRNQTFDHPMNLRLTSGTAPLDQVLPLVDALPVGMSIDYVRVFMPDTMPVIKLLHAPQIIQAGEGEGIRWATIAGVKSTLSVPSGFTAGRVAEDADEFWWVTAGKDLVPDQWYDLTINVSSDTGVEEHLVYPLYVQKKTPPGELLLPIRLFVTKTP
ncbi:MAG: glycoside hydrolase family 16 protein [Saprospiraceae bacterium]|nr:glycoside hydrolase family 16 protein [Saprospiraceae bacterium]